MLSERPLPNVLAQSMPRGYPLLAGDSFSPTLPLLNTVHQQFPSSRHTGPSALSPSASGQTVLPLDSLAAPSSVNKLEKNVLSKPLEAEQEQKNSLWKQPLKSPWVKGGLIMGTGWALGFTGQVAGFECVLIALAGLASSLILMNGFEAHQKVKAVSRELQQETAKHQALNQQA